MKHNKMMRSMTFVVSTKLSKLKLIETDDSSHFRCPDPTGEINSSVSIFHSVLYQQSNAKEGEMAGSDIKTCAPRTGKTNNQRKESRKKKVDGSGVTKVVIASSRPIRDNSKEPFVFHWIRSIFTQPTNQPRQSRNDETRSKTK